MSNCFTIITCLAIGCVAAVAAVAGSGEKHIDQVGQKFSVPSVSISMGDHLLFENHDDVQHNVKVVDADGDENDKGLQKPNEIIDVTFSQVGDFTIRCAIHPRMRMAVSVH